MKIVAALMTVVGILLCVGALMEFVYFGSDTAQFWAGVLAAPAGALFSVAGGVLWRRGPAARRLVRLSAVVMIAATVGATALDVMGPPATLLGALVPTAALLVTWRRANSSASLAS
jgi:hypothetical protein